MDDPDMGKWTYNYDALSNLTSQTDARGCTTNLTYDLLNRPTQKSYSNCSATSTVAYGYDSGTNGIGRRTSMNDGSGSATWNYDSRGRVTKETKVISGTSFVTEWTLYNSADLPVTMKYPDGEFVTTTYDNNMLPKTTIGNATYVSNTNYDSAGRMTSRALGNGLTQTYHYYDWNEKVNNIGQGGRLETLVTGSLQNLAYVYDKVGNITQITNSVASETNTYGYDDLDRLTSWALNGVNEGYSYDAQGNLDVKNGLDLNYNDASHKHAVTHIGSTQKYWYDQNGNQIARIVGADTFTLIYDAENRLVEVKKNNVTIAQFVFDGDGKRVKSVIGSETILFAGGHYEKKGSTITKYYFAGASRIAMRKYIIPQNMTVEYFIGDHLGSTSITTDNAGIKVSEMRYKPWGETRYTWTNAPANTSPAYELVKYQYTGQYSYVTEFGLHYYGARFYDSAVGRFVSADIVTPRGSQGLDRYAYANNDPVKYVDPSGHTATECSGEESCGGDDEVTAEMIESEFGIKISDPDNPLWTSQNLLLVYAALYAFRKFVGDDAFSYLSGVNIAVIGQSGDGSEFNRDTNTMELNPQAAFSASQALQYTIVHEAAHGVLFGLAGQNWNSESILISKYGLATGWTSATTKGPSGGYMTDWNNPGTGPTAYARGELRDANGNLVAVSPAEDYAESVSVLIYPWIPNQGVTQDRIDWINGNIRE